MGKSKINIMTSYKNKKVAVVIGATGNLGLAIVEALKTSQQKLWPDNQ